MQFVNHCCTASNCRFEEWIVGREQRVGLFTNKALDRGTILTVDYHAYNVSIDQLFECLCGSIRCRKIIGPGYPLRSNTYLTIEKGVVVEWAYGRRRLRQIQLDRIALETKNAEENGWDLLKSFLDPKHKPLFLRKLKEAQSKSRNIGDREEISKVSEYVPTLSTNLLK